jgi:alcohol dehydrogenase
LLSLIIQIFKINIMEPTISNELLSGVPGNLTEEDKTLNQAVQEDQLVNYNSSDTTTKGKSEIALKLAPNSTMHALVYHGAGKKKWEERPRPSVIDPSDAIIKILKTTICGTDLHILKGDVPEVTDGRILGHEGVGIVEEVGSAVTGFKKGERVLISCISSCGKCEYCKKGMYSHCEKGGWILGHLIDGTQAEYVRIPFADNSLYHAPENVDEEALVMLSDILPTAFECLVLNGQLKPGDTVAIIGAGPIGLAVLITAQFYTPASIIMVDLDDNRLNVGKTFGATETINSSKENALEKIMDLTCKKGVDVAIEAVGVAATFELCESIIAPGGHIANVGVHGKSVSLHLETLWSKNITITTRLVDTVTTPLLLKTVTSQKINPSKLITHRFALKDIVEAYDTFENAAREKTLKVILTNE